MKIVCIDPTPIFPKHQKEIEKLGELKQYSTKPKTDDEALKRIINAEIVVGFGYPMNEKLLKKLPNLKMICVAAAGYDWIDIKAAKKQGISATHCPGHSTDAVAEHTIALLLSANRSISFADKNCKLGKYRKNIPLSFDLKGKTLGIIGYGNIGKRVAEIAKNGFKMNVKYVNSKSTKQELTNLLKQSDYITINAPLTKKTNNLITNKEFKLMKDNVVIVNTGRGKIINEKDLIEAINAQKIYAVGLDVMATEPFDTKNELLKFPNVTVTPHIGWYTKETDYYLSKMVRDNIKAFIQKKPINLVKFS